MIKRYRINGIFSIGSDDACIMIQGALCKDPEGEWVKWEDVKPVIDRYNALISRMVIDDDGIHFGDIGIKIEPYDWPEVPELKGYQPKKSINPKEPPKRPDGEQTTEEKKCNCAEMFNMYLKVDNGDAILISRTGGGQEWVCPVHGYKKR